MKTLKEAFVYFFFAWLIGNLLLLLLILAKEQQFSVSDLGENLLLLGFLSAAISAPLILPIILFFWVSNIVKPSISSRMTLTSVFGLLISYGWVCFFSQGFGDSLTEMFEFYLPFIVGAVTAAPITIRIFNARKSDILNRDGTPEF